MVTIQDQQSVVKGKVSITRVFYKKDDYYVTDCTKVIKANNVTYILTSSTSNVVTKSGFTKRDENQEEENSGIYVTLKFKDPRDALNYFVKKWEKYPEKVLLRVMDYIEYGSTLEGEKQFTQLEFYYYIILKFQIQNQMNHK